MIELGALFTSTQAIGMQTQRDRGKSSGGSRDEFSAVFQMAADEGYSKKSSTGGVKQEGRLPPDKPELPGTGPAGQIEEEELPNELAALAGTSIIQSNQVQPQREAGTEQVVSILEGNMDIGAAEPVFPGEVTEASSVAAPVERTDEELTARMPLTQELARAPEDVDDTSPKPDNVISREIGGKLCPLENKNDPRPSENGGQEDQPAAKEDSRFTGTGQQVDIAPERLSSTEILASAAETSGPAPTATAETLFDTMVENMAMSSTAESKYMEIQLKPDFLGKVSIQLALGDNGLEIKIKADDPGVKSLIAGQITQLSEALAGKGVKVTSVDVIYTDVSENAFNQPGSGEGSQPQRAFHRYGYEAEPVSIGFGLGFSEEAAIPSAIDTGLSSVEYRA